MSHYYCPSGCGNLGHVKSFSCLAVRREIQFVSVLGNCGCRRHGERAEKREMGRSRAFTKWSPATWIYVLSFWILWSLISWKRAGFSQLGNNRVWSAEIPWSVISWDPLESDQFGNFGAWSVWKLWSLISLETMEPDQFGNYGVWSVGKLWKSVRNP